MLLSPVGARSVAQNSFETNSFRIKEGGRDRERQSLTGKRKWAKSPAREEALRESI